MTTPDERVPDETAPDDRTADRDGELVLDAGANPYAGILDGYLDDIDEGPVGPDTRTFDRHRVTAVLVTHNGARWLPYALAALERLALPPGRVLAVDTGSKDSSLDQLAAALGPAAVVRASDGTGFGAAVAQAVDALRTAPGLPGPADDDGPVVEWLWLLHDDCAPEPETLRRLLSVVDADPAVAIAGPKVRGWHDSSRLLEVGVSIGGGGRRETGLDRGELDQGQHDGRRDVLAVGSAGMLVRRDVWDQLGGFDPGLPLFRDDVDLGWRANLAGHRVVVVPEAVLHHVEAAGHGRRRLPARYGSAHRADRRSAVRVLLADCPAYALPWHWLRLAVGTLLRTLGLLLGKAPAEAWAEVSGAVPVLLGPFSLARARAARRPLRQVPAREVRHLLPAWTAGLRHGLDAVGALVSGRVDLSATTGSALESGPTDDESEDMVAAPSRVRLMLGRPGVQLTLGMTLLALLTFRGLLWGSGLLQGGALLPAPDGAHDLWSGYATGWHDVGVGSSIAAPAYLVPVAVLSSVLLGKAWLAVDLLLLLAAPLAALVAYRLLGRVAPARNVRVAAAVAYALLPAVTGAVASGRLGTALAAWLLPLALWTGGRALGLGGPTSGGRAWLAGLMLAVVVAFVPLAWLLALIAGVGTVLLWRARSVRSWWRLAVVLAVPPLVLLPWTGHALHDPAVLLLEAGAPSAALADRALPAWHAAVANPGGPGVPPAWITVPLVLVALAALLRTDRRRAVATAWLVALSGLVVSLASVGRVVVPASLGTEVPLWPGTPTLVLGAGLIAAAALGADGSRVRLRSYRFGWRQPGAAVLAVVALVAPVGLGLTWLFRGASDVLVSASPDVVPPFVQLSSSGPDRPRTLLLQSNGTTATYGLVPGEGRRLGDAEVAPSVTLTRRLDGTVQALLAGAGDLTQTQVLQWYAVAYVVLVAPVDPVLARRLDRTPGLVRVSAATTGALWRVVPPGVRVQLQRPPADPVTIPSDPGTDVTTVDTVVPPPSGPGVPPGSTDGLAGTLRLADANDPGWTARADGHPLVGSTVDGWAQAFEVPATAQRVQVSYTDDRATWLRVQGAVAFVVVLLALPSWRRRESDDGDEPDGPALVAQAPTPDPASDPFPDLPPDPPSKPDPDLVPEEVR
jgi:GT2 family glycosyltransferase